MPKKQEPKTITLPSGSVAVVKPFKASDFIEMKKTISKDMPEDHFMWTLIAATTTIDGETLVMEDVGEMDGWDYLTLLGEFAAVKNFMETSPAK